MEGKALVRSVIEATGVKCQSLESEFKKILENSNASEETLTLEQLREALASYLQEVLVEAKNRFESTG